MIPKYDFIVIRYSIIFQKTETNHNYKTENTTKQKVNVDVFSDLLWCF